MRWPNGHSKMLLHTARTRAPKARTHSLARSECTNTTCVHALVQSRACCAACARQARARLQQRARCRTHRLNDAFRRAAIFLWCTLANKRCIELRAERESDRLCRQLVLLQPSVAVCWLAVRAAASMLNTTFLCSSVGSACGPTSWQWRRGETCDRTTCNTVFSVRTTTT